MLVKSINKDSKTIEVNITNFIKQTLVKPKLSRVKYYYDMDGLTNKYHSTPDNNLWYLDGNMVDPDDKVALAEYFGFEITSW